MKKLRKRLMVLFVSLLLVIGMSTSASAATKVKISQKSATVFVSKSVALKITGTKTKPKWSSSNSKVAKVNSKGKVTGVAAGKATIKAKVGKKTYSCKVTVKQGLSLTKLSLDKGKKTTLKLYGTKVKSVSSSKKTVATIDKKLRITAKKKGSCTLTVKATNGKTYKCKVTVVQKVTGVTLNLQSLSMKTGEKQSLTAAVSPSDANNKAVTWATSNAAVAIVDQSGNVTAAGPGSAFITATAGDGSGKAATCTVTVVQPVTAVSVTPGSSTLEIGKTVQLSATVSPSNANNKTVAWTTSNAGVATVSQSGLVTAAGSGSAVITATAADGSGKAASCTVTVAQPVTAVSVTPGSSTLEIGKTVQLSASVSPSNASNKALTWTTSNASVATVDQNGTVTAKGEGSVVITATAADGSGKSAACTITVYNTSRTVTNQQELEAALTQSTLEKLTINSSAQEAAFTIPAGDYSNVELDVDVPNGEVTNNAKFENITIHSISAHTFVERAEGNQILFLAPSGRIRIDSDAAASIEVGEAGAGTIPNLRIDNLSVVTQLTLNVQANVSISSENNRRIPVISNTGAAGSTVETDTNLSLTAESRITLVLNAGAENTVAAVTNNDHIPVVTGLGRVTVTNTVTSEVESVVAENTGNEEQSTVNVSGKVEAAGEGNAALRDVTLYLLKYSSDIDRENISSYYDSAQRSVTDENGFYAFADVPLGNYYLAAEAEGYVSNLQTVVVTSVNDGDFHNEIIRLAAAGSEETGGISGVIIDAQTGDAITYPVTLKIRKGQNQLSGEALLTVPVSADENGSYAVMDQQAGNYTIQILGEGVTMTPVNVTVVSGSIITENPTVTKELADEGQVRFVLTWGNRESGAPSDLDSHLVGPAADGEGMLHTWFSDRNYYYGDEKYADLDVDDVDWEGPETTTIYHETPGVYSFYVYDYTDQDDGNSSIMSSKSSAVVKVYQGDSLRDTFNIPVNKNGILWHVCDYDSVTKSFKGVNTVEYWIDDGGEYIGQNIASRLRDRLKDKIDELTEVLKLVADGSYKSEAEAALVQAQALCDEESEDETAIRALTESLNNYISRIRNGVSIDAISGENVVDYDIYYNMIYIYGFAQTLGDIQITASNIEGANCIVSCEDVQDQDYVKKITVTDEAIGLTRSWNVYYQYNTKVFEIKGVSGEEINWHTYHCRNDRGELYVYGLTDEMPPLTISVNDGVTYTVTSSENGTVLSMSYEGHTYEYDVYYEFDENVFDFWNVSGEGIISCSTDQEDLCLLLEGLGDELPEFTIATSELTSYEISKDELGTVVLRLTCGTHSREYTVIYTQISAETLTVDSLYDVSGSKVYYSFTPEISGSYTLTSFTADENDDPNAILYSYDGKYLEDNDDGGSKWNFALKYDLEAGATYYYLVSGIYNGGQVQLTYNGVIDETEAASFDHAAAAPEPENSPEAEGFGAEEELSAGDTEAESFISEETAEVFAEDTAEEGAEVPEVFAVFGDGE